MLSRPLRRPGVRVLLSPEAWAICRTSSWLSASEWAPSSPRTSSATIPRASRESAAPVKRSFPSARTVKRTWTTDTQPATLVCAPRSSSGTLGSESPNRMRRIVRSRSSQERSTAASLASFRGNGPGVWPAIFMRLVARRAPLGYELAPGDGGFMLKELPRWWHARARAAAFPEALVALAVLAMKMSDAVHPPACAFALAFVGGSKGPMFAIGPLIGCATAVTVRQRRAGSAPARGHTPSTVQHTGSDLRKNQTHKL